MLRTTTIPALMGLALLASSSAYAREPSSGSFRCHLRGHWVGVTLDVQAMTMAIDEERWYGAEIVGRDTRKGPATRYEDEHVITYEMNTDAYAYGDYLWFPKDRNEVAFTFCWDCEPYICQ